MSKKKLPNPNIATAGKRFEKGDPRAAEAARAAAKVRKARGDIRANARRLACFEPPEDAEGKPVVTFKSLKQAFGADIKGKKLCMGEIWAVIHAQQASQNFKAMKDLIENVSGKQVDTHLVKTTKSWAELVNAAAGNSPTPKTDDDDPTDE